jgi:hypothetical protein
VSESEKIAMRKKQPQHVNRFIEWYKQRQITSVLFLVSTTVHLQLTQAPWLKEKQVCNPKWMKTISKFISLSSWMIWIHVAPWCVEIGTWNIRKVRYKWKHGTHCDGWA